MPVKYGAERAYDVECEACGILETMVFLRRPGRLAYRYVPATCVRPGLGVVKNVFDPVSGVTGDRPPKVCPCCGESLRVTPIQLKH